MLDWTTAELAERAGVSLTTIRGWENHRHSPRPATREKIQQAFERAGICFSNGRRPSVMLNLDLVGGAGHADFD